MKSYVVRRAKETKRYREVAEETGVQYDWLCKLAQNAIAEPGVDKVEKLFHYYKAREGVGQRA